MASQVQAAATPSRQGGADEVERRAVAHYAELAAAPVFTWLRSPTRSELHARLAEGGELTCGVAFEASSSRGAQLMLRLASGDCALAAIPRVMPPAPAALLAIVSPATSYTVVIENVMQDLVMHAVGQAPLRGLLLKWAHAAMAADDGCGGGGGPVAAKTLLLHGLDAALANLAEPTAVAEFAESVKAVVAAAVSDVAHISYVAVSLTPELSVLMTKDARSGETAWSLQYNPLGACVATSATAGTAADALRALGPCAVQWPLPSTLALHGVFSLVLAAVHGYVVGAKLTLAACAVARALRHCATMRKALAAAKAAAVLPPAAPPSVSSGDGSGGIITGADIEHLHAQVMAAEAALAEAQAEEDAVRARLRVDAAAPLPLGTQVYRALGSGGEQQGGTTTLTRSKVVAAFLIDDSTHVAAEARVSAACGVAEGLVEGVARVVLGASHAAHDAAAGDGGSHARSVLAVQLAHAHGRSARGSAGGANEAGSGAGNGTGSGTDASAGSGAARKRARGGSNVRAVAFIAPDAEPDAEDT